MERNPYAPPTADIDPPLPTHLPTMLLLASFGNVIEAQVLKDLLVVEGIAASLSDAHTVQSNALWTNAMGGVRVMVPAASLERARELMEEVQAGALALEGDVDPSLPLPVLATDRAFWNADLAALFSLVLTPVFGSVLLLLNERTMAEARYRRSAIAWLAISIAVVCAAIWKLCTDGSAASPWLGFKASGLATPYTIAWYFLGAHAQSSRIARAHGRKYVHRSVVRASVPALVVIAAIGAVSMAL